ncbi:hypothetical protein B484DRAFT_321834 [Ochromonadaceae sp. CCMP2298]|nr:hypothetical protein B484DRAFT_321834 [Ochromonadaceae sp. CCMP2298]
MKLPLLLLLVLLLVPQTVNALAEKAPVPRSIADSAKPNFKPIIGGFALVGLAFGKKAVNGPNFEEAVSLAGKVAVITGANVGLGKETAVKLASLGAKTILLCKTPARAEAAVEEIRQRSGGDVSWLQLDLGDLRSVERCAEQLKQTVPRIDILCNNAGVMAIPEREVTKDGFEKHLGINHLGHFALTGLLWPLLAQAPPPSTGTGTGAAYTRIVTVASAAHLLGSGDVMRNDLMLTGEGGYGPWPAYGNSKLANILFSAELDRRIRNGPPSSIAAVSCHPGGCRTELGRYIVDIDKIPPVVLPLLGSAQEGAQTQIYLSASSLRPSSGGLYFDNSAPTDPSPAAQDVGLAAYLWGESERLTGVKYPI